MNATVIVQSAAPPPAAPALRPWLFAGLLITLVFHRHMRATTAGADRP